MDLLWTRAKEDPTSAFYFVAFLCFFIAGASALGGVVYCLMALTSFSAVSFTGWMRLLVFSFAGSAALGICSGAGMIAVIISGLIRGDV